MRRSGSRFEKGDATYRSEGLEILDQLLKEHKADCYCSRSEEEGGKGTWAEVSSSAQA